MDSGLKDDLVLGDPEAPRFVLWNGKLRPVPSKPTDFPFFDLMSFAGKLRAGFGALGLRPPPPVCSLPDLFLCPFCFFLKNRLSHITYFEEGDRVVRNQLKSLYVEILVMKYLNVS